MDARNPVPARDMAQEGVAFGTRRQRAAPAGAFHRSDNTKKKYNTVRNNLRKVIDEHNEMFLAHVRRTEPDIYRDLSSRAVPKNEWFDADAPGFSQILFNRLKLADEYADSLICWRLGHPPRDASVIESLPWDPEFEKDWEHYGFVTLSKNDVLHLIALFGDEHRRRSKKKNDASESPADCHLSTVKRYGEHIWIEWSEHQHRLKIKSGGAPSISKPTITPLCDVFPAFKQMLISKGNARLRTGNRIDCISHAQELITDGQVVAVVRYCLLSDTLMLRLKLTYFLVALNTHRRAGKEQASLDKTAFTVTKHGNHEVLMVDMQFESKTQNFNSRAQYVHKAAVMVVCPLTVSLVKWLLNATRHCGTQCLWPKPINGRLLCANLKPEQHIFKPDVYKGRTLASWVKEVVSAAMRFHSSHCLGGDIPFDRVWPTGTNSDVNAGTGLRKHAESAMQVAAVPEKEALLRSGRACNESRDSYTQDARIKHNGFTLAAQFKIGCICMVPRIMGKECVLCLLRSIIGFLLQIQPPFRTMRRKCQSLLTSSPTRRRACLRYSWTAGSCPLTRTRYHATTRERHFTWQLRLVMTSILPALRQLRSGLTSKTSLKLLTPFQTPAAKDRLSRCAQMLILFCHRRSSMTTLNSTLCINSPVSDTVADMSSERRTVRIDCNATLIASLSCGSKRATLDLV